MSGLPEPKTINGLNGWRESYVASTGSTNADLLLHARQGHDADRLWLVASEQVQGKGRRGRTWVSPPGNLYASLLLVDPAESTEIGFLPLVCAVAIHRAFTAAMEGTGNDVKIKWPNDILINGAKCCGMLLESEWIDDKLHIVIGCGINLVAHPDDTPYPAINLKALGVTLSPTAMFQYLAEAFARTLEEWRAGAGNKAIRDYWLHHARGIGKTIAINLEKNALEGIFDGINANGFLLLRDSSGHTHEISAGDVFFPHLNT